MAEGAPEHPHFARFYERMIAGAERAGLADMRRAIVGRAKGRTIEIGAGTGLNLPHYTSAVTRLVLTEPDPHMAVQIPEHPRTSRSSRWDDDSGTFDGVPEVVRAGAEALPFEDASFDTVVTTLVLCTVPEPEASLAEMRRVLVPGGELLYLEHVRGDGPVRSRFQDLLNRPWGFVAGGCNLNRPTGEALAAAGFDVSGLERTRMPKAPPWISPMIQGSATAR